jgi:hypothetical protein
MGRRLKAHVTATITPEAAEYLEWVADQFFGGNRSEALDAIVKYAKEHGFHILGIVVGKNQA